MILTILAALAIIALADPDPLGAAREGMVRCYRPDLERTTCRAIASYRFEQDGRIINDAENLLSATPLIILRGRNDVFVPAGAECSTDPFTESSIVGIDVDGLQLANEQLATVRSALVPHWP